MQLYLKKFLIIVSVLIIFFLSISIVYATITIPTNVYFGFGTGNYIKFSTQQTFNTVYRENGFWIFDGYGFQVQSANATINYINVNGKGEVILSAPTGTVSSLILKYPANYPPEVAVSVDFSLQTIPDSKYFRNKTNWLQAPPPAIYLDDINKQLQVKVKHASDAVITIYW
ncbi:MAG: hypothetical protein ACP5IZ_12050, partial [Thermoprotei archaeon]